MKTGLKSTDLILIGLATILGVGGWLKYTHRPTLPLPTNVSNSPQSAIENSINDTKVVPANSRKPLYHPITRTQDTTRKSFEFDILDFLKTEIFDEPEGTNYGRLFWRTHSLTASAPEPVIFWVKDGSMNPNFDVLTYDDNFVYLRYEVIQRNFRSGSVRRIEGLSQPVALQNPIQGHWLAAPKGRGRIFFPRMLNENDAGKIFLLPYFTDDFQIGDGQWQPRRVSQKPQVAVSWFEIIFGNFSDALTGINYPFLLRIYTQEFECVISRTDLALKLGIYDSRILQNISSENCLTELKNRIVQDRKGPKGETLYSLNWGEEVSMSGQQPLRFYDNKGGEFEVHELTNRWNGQNHQRWILKDSNVPVDINPRYPPYSVPSFVVPSAGVDIRKLPYLHSKRPGN